MTEWGKDLIAAGILIFSMLFLIKMLEATWRLLTRRPRKNKSDQ